MDKFLEEVIDYGKQFTDEGKLVDYIAILKDADKHALGACIIDENGKVHEAGRSQEEFAIMSIVKVVLFEIVLENYKLSEIEKYIGLEGSSKPYNSILDLEAEGGKPVNPFINAGAIMSSYLIYKKFKDKSIDVLMERIRILMDNEELTHNQELLDTVKFGGENNLALAWILKKHGYIDKDTSVDDVLYIYNLACCIMVDTRDLAVFASTMSRHGKGLNGDQIIKKENARILRTLMAICGTYDFAGEFAVKIGIPAKSGVGGGIMATTNKDIGVCVFCPGLDSFGNSLAGVKMLEKISRELDLYYY
ncbi:glutaminase A [Peptoniphilus sp. MSJ-1]|uniref:Glutaminase n=1 Tax=Peptoniphilus ovalis TaxID=2841503 RepID=A0ABS6FHR7_9FIRM|nr:glutaminase A [Peptoniphilus ovalis]MBU5669714.1 glutaminase A [Peptoniphilus ovalis]